VVYGPKITLVRSRTLRSDSGSGTVPGEMFSSDTILSR